MKRYFLIFLLMLLPLQFSWAAAGAYCAHEEGLAAQHFGHHVHKHDSNSNDAKETPQKAKTDIDCEYCHHVSASAIFAAAPFQHAPQRSAHMRFEVHRYASHIPDLIPRPDWPALA